MGLQNQLADVSTESIPILLIALIANCVGYLRSIFILAFQALGFSLSPFDDNFFDTVHGQNDNVLCDAVGSGLTGVIMLAEQLNLNRALSYEFDDGTKSGGGDQPAGLDCVVCLNQFEEGDRVRRLVCRHVFHKRCIDGWLDHLNFSCPFCRVTLVADERVAVTRRRVAGDMLAWFSLS